MKDSAKTELASLHGALFLAAQQLECIAETLDKTARSIGDSLNAGDYDDD